MNTLEEFVLPAGVLNNHIAVLGKTGSGKTSTSKLIVERVVDQGHRVCVLDTVKSDWWGLTSSRDGKHPGFDFKILGGPRGHVPLHSNAGKAIGQLVGSAKLQHSIIDMADFEAGGIQKFFVDFAPSLMRNMKGVLYLVIEEAHEVAPKERAGFGAENMAIHFAKKLATAGRSKGIRLIVATQSVQQLHNRVLGSAETLIAHRLTAPADQEPVIKWLKANTEKDTALKIAAEMSSVRTGTGWVCSGEVKFFEKVKFPKFSTYDNTATPTGDLAVREIKTTPVNQDELKAIIGDAVEEAKANDPAELKLQLRKKDAEIKRLTDIQKIPHPVKVELDVQEIPILTKSNEAAIGKLITALGDLEKVYSSYRDSDAALQALRDKSTGRKYEIINDFRDMLEKDLIRFNQKRPVHRGQGIQPEVHFRVSGEVKKLTRPFETMVKKKIEPTNGETKLGLAATRMLTVCLTYPEGKLFSTVCTLAGYSPRKSTVRNAMTELRAAKAVIEDGDMLRPDWNAMALIPNFKPLPQGQELIDHWLNELPAAPRRILEFLIEHTDVFVTPEQIQEATGIDVSKSTYRNAKTVLRANEVIEEHGDEMRANQALFE